MLEGGAVVVIYWQLYADGTRRPACDKFEGKHFKKTGFKLNDGTSFPGQMPGRFFRCEMMQTSSMRLCEDLMSFFFAWRLVTYKIIWENSTSLDQIYSAEKKEGKISRRSGPGMDTQNMCANSHGLSLKNGVNISIFEWKTCALCVPGCICNCLVLV